MGFLELRRHCEVSHKIRGGAKEPLVWHHGSQVSIRVARGSPSLISSHGMVMGPQNALKKDSRGLSRVMAENPAFTLLVTVTSGSFSGCL